MLEQEIQDRQAERRGSWLDKHKSNQQGNVIYVLSTTQQHHVMSAMIKKPILSSVHF